MEQLREGQKIIFTIKDKIDKVKFANSAYGYTSGNGNWPESKMADFAALTRLVETLFRYCDEVTVDGNIVYSKSGKAIFKEPESSISSSKSESSDIIDFESIVQTSKIKLVFI